MKRQASAFFNHSLLSTEVQSLQSLNSRTILVSLASLESRGSRRSRKLRCQVLLESSPSAGKSSFMKEPRAEGGIQEIMFTQKKPYI